MQENSTEGDRSAQCLPADLSWEASLLAALQDGLPRDTGCWLHVPRENRICPMCQQSVLGDEKHFVSECPAL